MRQAADEPVAEADEDGELGDLEAMRGVVAGHIAFCDAHPDFQCLVVRREAVGRSLQDEERLLMKYRSQPRSVYYQWLDDAHAGRECIWVEDANEGKIITRGGKGDFPFAGRQIAVSPDGLLAKARSRYSIRRSGLRPSTRTLADMLGVEDGVDLAEDGQVTVTPEDATSRLRNLGVKVRPDIQTPAHAIHEDIPPGTNDLFPKGGMRLYLFDIDEGRLRLIEARDHEGNLVEYYSYERFIPDPNLTDTDFDPDHVWGRATASKESSPAR